MRIFIKSENLTVEFESKKEEYYGKDIADIFKEYLLLIKEIK